MEEATRWLSSKPEPGSVEAEANDAREKQLIELVMQLKKRFEAMEAKLTPFETQTYRDWLHVVMSDIGEEDFDEAESNAREAIEVLEILEAKIANR